MTAGATLPVMLTIDENFEYFSEHGAPCADDLFSAMCRVGRTRAPALLADLYYEGLLSPEAAIATVGAAWSDAEFPDRTLDRDCWRSLFDEAGYTVDGKTASRPHGSMILFRGAVVTPPRRRRDWSWTDDLEVARRFAKGLLGRRPGVVWTATVAPWRLLAHNTGRDESEYVIDTHRLRIVEHERPNTSQVQDATP